MKKLSIILAVLATALSFASCEDDKEPVYKAPTEFVLNTPALQNELLELTPTGTFELTCSQPDYGYSAITNYSAEVSLTEDFAKFETIASDGTGTNARMTFKSEALAIAMCNLHGYESKDDYVNPGPERIYFRAVASLAGVESSRIVSNTVYLDKVQGFYAKKEPGRIYVVGAFSNGVEWGVDSKTAQDFVNAGQYLDETGVETGVYTGIVTFPAGEVYFRLYTEIGNWGSDNALPSIGPNGVDGDNTEADITTTATTFTAVPGKGSWFTPATFAGGPVTMMFDMNRMELTLTAGAQTVIVPKYVYMVGNQADWATPDQANAAAYEPWRLTDDSESGIYTGTFTISHLQNNDSDLYCRFYKALNGWGAAQWASTTGENYEVTSGIAAPTAEGEGCFMLKGAIDKTITVTLDTNANTVTFTEQ